MAAGGMADIPVCRVTPMRMLESQSQRICFARNRDQVNVIGHEAVADQRKLMQRSIVPEQVRIDQLFGIGSQNELPGISTLGNMVRDIHGNHRSQTGHAYKVTDNVPSVPGLSRFILPMGTGLPAYFMLKLMLSFAVDIVAYPLETSCRSSSVSLSVMKTLPRMPV